MKDKKQSELIVQQELDELFDSTDNFRKSRSKRKKPSVFYVIYFALIGLFLISLTVGLIVEHSALGAYEDSQPKYKAEEVFNHYFSNVNESTFVSLVSDEDAIFEKKEDIAAFIYEKVKDGEFSYSQTVSTENGVYVYNVYSSDARFATFSLAPSVESGDFGFPIYELRDIRLTFIMPSNSYRILVPEGYFLAANSVAVPDRFKEDTKVPTQAYTLTGGTNGVLYNAYTVTGFLSTPEFSVTDAAGVSVKLDYDSENEYYFVPTKKLNVRALTTQTVYVGSYAVGEGFIVGERVPSAYNAFLCEGAEALEYVSYCIEGFTNAPIVRVKAEDGSVSTLRYIEDEDTYESYPSYSKTLKAENSEWILNVFYKYVLYLQNIEGTAKSDIKPYFDTSSAIWKHINSIDPGWQYEASSYEFTNDTADNFTKTGEDSFFCRVKLTYNGTRKNQSYTENIDVIVFFKRSSDKYLIYDIVNVGAIEGVGAPS